MAHQGLHEPLEPAQPTDAYASLAMWNSASGRPESTKPSHAFAKAVGKFVQALATVPDYPSATFSDDAVARLLSLSEQVIEQIDHLGGRRIR